MIIKNESKDLITALTHLDKYCKSRNCAGCLLYNLGECFKNTLVKEVIQPNCNIAHDNKICHYDIEKYMNSIK